MDDGKEFESKNPFKVKKTNFKCMMEKNFKVKIPLK